jgi:prephenate dehydrogenase
MKPNTVHVIGGLGRMGALMARVFTESGCRVLIFDRQNGPVDWDAAARSDLIVLAVPMNAMEETASALGPRCDAGTTVFDVASLKQSAAATMTRWFSGEIIGGHPLFGPDVKSLDGLTFFVCPIRPEGRWSWLKRTLAAQGADVVEIDPVEHDRLMSRVMTLRHLLLFCFGRGLMRLDFHPTEGADSGSRWFAALIRQLHNQLDQSPALYADLAAFNPEFESVADELTAAAAEVVDVFRSGQTERIANLIESMSEFCGRAGPTPATA